MNNKLQDLRKKQNLSQEQLAEKIGVARQTISKWELGESAPDLEQSKKLSQIFNVSLDELTNNNIKNILIEKANNTEKLTISIINILKIILLCIIIIVVILISTIYFKDYFDVSPVDVSYAMDCTIKDKEYSYEILMNNETSYIIDKLITNDKEINIDTTKYINIEQIFNAIDADVTSRGGFCNNNYQKR